MSDRISRVKIAAFMLCGTLMCSAVSDEQPDINNIIAESAKKLYNGNLNLRIKVLQTSGINSSTETSNSIIILKKRLKGKEYVHNGSSETISDGSIVVNINASRKSIIISGVKKMGKISGSSKNEFPVLIPDTLVNSTATVNAQFINKNHLNLTISDTSAPITKTEFIFRVSNSRLERVIYTYHTKYTLITGISRSELEYDYLPVRKIRKSPEFNFSKYTKKNKNGIYEGVGAYHDFEIINLLRK